jgi:protein with PEP-CTERM/exosortase system signal
MKLKMIPINRLALLCAAFCAAMLAFSHNANALRMPLPPTPALTIGDSHTLGYVFNGIPSGDALRTQYVNDLVFEYNQGHSSGFTFSASGQNYTLVNGSPAFGATLPGAVFDHNGTGNTGIDLGAVGTFTYLFAKYDGPNGGSVVWYVGNLGGLIDIPANGLLPGETYGLSGWTLFTGGTPPTSLPDGGTTVMLLGTALGALGMVRLYIMR